MKAEVLNEFVTLYEGDCLDVLASMEPGSVDAVVTDPPYGVSYQSGRCPDSKRFAVLDGDDAPRVEWVPLAKPLLKASGCLLCFCEWKFAEDFRAAIASAGFHIGAQLVWDRIVHGMGDLKGRPSPQHDLIWFGVHGRYKLPGSRPSSVYRFQRLGGHELQHPTQKPIDLMRQLVTDYSATEQVVLDPFAGSGTTGVAAMLEGRRCVLIEKDPKFCDVIRRRIDQASGVGERSLFRQTEMQFEIAGA